MQELEKIFEEIEEEQRSYEADHAWNYARGMEHAADIIRKHMKNEEDILKFYYCESEDDYYIGQRVQNMYYARYADGAFTWFMSRYLPWGKHVIAPETAWKEYTYPTEPKEIPFTEWLEGFIRKHMNVGWIPVDERLPEMFGKYWATIRYDDGRISEPIVVDFRGVRQKYVVDTPNGREYETWGIDSAFHGSRVIAWRPYYIPEPYRPERSRENEK